jgi:hypothetical protein
MELMIRAHYQDGELVPYKPGAGIDPKPAAANDGTIINASPPLIAISDIDLTKNRQKIYFTICHYVNELLNPLRTNIIVYWM